MKIEVTRLEPGLPLPSYARRDDAGLDLFAAEDAELKPGERAALPTGIAVAIPAGYAGFVHPRSGRALEEGLTVANAPGTIDSGYRGQVKVILVNLDPTEPVYIKRGEKIAQLVVQRIETADLVEVDDLSDSERGEKGFGSTGK